MRYWPMSVILTSPLMPQYAAWEIQRYAAGGPLPSQHVVNAMCGVTGSVKPVEMPNMVHVHTERGPQDFRMHYTYLRYPSFEEWRALERGGAGEDDVGSAAFVNHRH